MKKILKIIYVKRCLFDSNQCDRALSKFERTVILFFTPENFGRLRLLQIFKKKVNLNKNVIIK